MSTSRVGQRKVLKLICCKKTLTENLKKVSKEWVPTKHRDQISRSAGGTAEIINNFDEVIGIKKKGSSHKHKSSEQDESLILSDLLPLKPFATKTIC